ncbi:hypothetical protein CTZ27_13085 [Streptomyces griseocarneus]|nr:hypothetical protein CTZ27_13085 [Streptomyces griseocarneus]
MTSTTGTDEHPEVTEISALAEGALSPSRSADLREHLADCELCEEVRTSLDEIRTLLGTLPGPSRMPEDVAGRIDAALAAEALLDATAARSLDASDNEGSLVSRETAAPHSESVSRETAARPSEGVSRETATLPPEDVSRETAEAPDGRTMLPARVSRETSVRRPTSRPSAATGPGRRRPSPGKARPRPSRLWPKALLGAACAAAALGVGVTLLLPGDSGKQDRPQAVHESQSPDVLASGDLKTRVHELLATSSRTTQFQGKHSESSDAPMRDFGATAPSCVQQGIGRSDQILASQQDGYKGVPAYLVVLPHPSDTKLVDAYVVSSACVEAAPPAPGEVLLHRTLPRT